MQVASKAVVTIDLKQSSSALCTCASCFYRQFHKIIFVKELLLCALVQVASLSKTDFVPQQFNFCSVHLCKLLLAHEYGGDLNNVLLLCALVQVASGIEDNVEGLVVLLLCALVQVASAKLHSSLRQAVEAICIGAQLHIISKCELPFNSTIDSNDMIVRHANLSWQQ